MNLVELRSETRRRLDDRALPTLWSDLEIDGWINEAEREAAERARLIHDETTPRVARINARIGVGRYELDPHVIAVDRVYSPSRGYVLARTTREKLDEGRGRWQTRTGSPCEFFERENYIRLVPSPIAVEVIELAVWRLPLRQMADDCHCPEIASRNHERLLDWVLHRAYSRKDSDTESPIEAANHEKAFEASFGIRRDSNVQRKQRLHRVPIVKRRW